MTVVTSGQMAQPVKPRKRSGVKPATVISYVVLLSLAIIFVIPYYLIFRNALLTQPQILSFDWVWLPIPPHFENIQALFDDPSAPMATGLRNSVIIAVVQTFGQIMIASLAGRIPARGALPRFHPRW